MQSVSVLVLALALSCTLAVDVTLDKHWNLWKQANQKLYAGIEENLRRGIWEDNLKIVQEHNLKADLGVHTYWLGMNKFADLTTPEFVKMMNGYNASLSTSRTGRAIHTVNPSVKAPDSVDWRTKGYVTPIKDQAQCGSCWAFSSTGSLEGQHFKATGKLVSLSEQNLVDCSGKQGNQGCNGGLMDQAFTYIKENNGIDTEDSYQYEARDGQCRFKAETVGATDTGFKDIAIWDTFTHQPGKIKGNSTGDVAVDQYHRFAEDIWLLKDLNMDAYRFSIAWSRIFPEGVGEVNWEGVKYYDALINHLLELDIAPYVTLYHWDMPQALEDSMGGWLSPDIVEPFTRFARFCFQRWGSRVKYWITFNEIHSFAGAGYFSGEMAPGRCSDRTICAAGNSSTEPYLVSHHALLAHAHTVHLYKKEFQAAQKGVIGITADCTWYAPLDENSVSDQKASQDSIEGFLGWYLDPIFFGDYPASMRTSLGSDLPTFTEEEVGLIKGSQDFIGINHYSSMYVTVNDSNGEITKTGYKDGVPIGDPTPSDWLFVAPSGMRKLLGWVRERYNNPVVYITENGRDEANTDDSATLADQLKDPERIQYYHDYMQNVLLAISDGSTIRGYFAWSLMDNFEWAVGFTVRFGLYYVDYKNDLARYPKSSVYWFQQILKKTSHES